ncbi:MAG: hypothetical protein Q4C95_05705 [Planctomycetia bacterium]|nr:hypothetical protein [Planctomycetia bacterium]
MKNYCRFLTNVSRFLLLTATFICLNPIAVSAQIGGFGGYIPPQTNNDSLNNVQKNQNVGNVQNENQLGKQTSNGNLFSGQKSTSGNNLPAISQTAAQNGQILYNNQFNGINQTQENGQVVGDLNNSSNSMSQENSIQSANITKPEKVANPESSKERIIPPPKDFQLSEVDLIRLNEFLNHWENFGKSIKRISCNVQVKEFDGGLFHKDSNIPISHTWGQFRFIAPNKILYHVRGDFSYQGFEDGKEPKWQESNNEWKFVYDGKSMTHYDFVKTTATVIPIVESEWNQDLTLESPFPLFFVANAQNLKNRFYMRLITKPEKAKTEVWIEAVPRYLDDAKNFKSIIITLRLKDLQPYYMRKFGVNGKSYTDFTFEDIAVNKGNWGIESNVNLTWTKKVEPEYSFKQGTNSVKSTAQNQRFEKNQKSSDSESNSEIRQQQQNTAVQPTSSFNPSSQRF